MYFLLFHLQNRRHRVGTDSVVQGAAVPMDIDGAGGPSGISLATTAVQLTSMTRNYGTGGASGSGLAGRSAAVAAIEPKLIIPVIPSEKWIDKEINFLRQLLVDPGTRKRETGIATTRKTLGEEEWQKMAAALKHSFSGCPRRTTEEFKAKALALYPELCNVKKNGHQFARTL
jgi:hypothetical protein